jgi:hypothetical protein
LHDNFGVGCTPSGLKTLPEILWSLTLKTAEFAVSITRRE